MSWDRFNERFYAGWQRMLASPLFFAVYAAVVIAAVLLLAFHPWDH